MSTTSRIDWWMSSNSMTVLVTTDEKLIIKDAPAIVRMFIGQPLSNLENWMVRQGGFIKHKYGTSSCNSM